MDTSVFKKDGTFRKRGLERAKKHGTPVYSQTGMWIKGWQFNGQYVPNPLFTPDNVFKMRLMILETVNLLLKKGFEVVKEKSPVFGATGIITLRKGSEEKKVTLGRDEHEEIMKHIFKPTFAVK